MKATLKTKTYAVCPACNEGEFSVDHIIADNRERAFPAGPWYCDTCGAGITFNMTADGLVVEDSGEKKIDLSVLLKIPPQAKPIWLLVKGMRFEGPRHKDDDRDPHDKRYFYEEHTCPTNYLHDTACIMIDGDTDPHGLAEFIEAEDGNPDSDDCELERTTIERMVSKQEAIDGTAVTPSGLILPAKSER